MSDQQENIFLELQAAITLLRSKHLSTNNREVSEVKMVRHGLAAMMASMGDTFTNYIPPVQLTSYQSKKVQTIVGIGLVVDYDREGKARVISALEGSPADRDDLPTGAEILRVNGKNARKADVKLLNNLLNGPEGSIANLDLILHGGESRSVEVERKPVTVEHVRFYDIDSDIVFVRIGWFSGTCYTEFLEQLKSCVDRGVKGIVLDLRSNSGGSIISTRNIFSSICDQEVMYYSRRAENENIKDRMLGEHLFDLQTTIILNEGTFSAGEILAGALRDYDKALLVGTKSGGKGSMQQVFPLGGQIEGAMRITTATNCTPKGHVIQGNGIEPDYLVDQEFAELFVEDGAVNYPVSGRDYLRKIRSEKLAAIHGRERIDKVLLAGDKQKKKAVAVLRELIVKQQAKTGDVAKIAAGKTPEKQDQIKTQSDPAKSEQVSGDGG